MASSHQSRRTFITRVALLLLAAAGLRRYLTPRLPSGGMVLLRVPAGELATGGALVYREARIALVREGDTVRALSLVCTHLGCTVTVTPDGLSCPCHGSIFDRQGRVLRGPADRPLAVYEVRREGGMLEVLAG